MREIAKKDILATLERWSKDLPLMSLESQREYNAAAYEWSRQRLEKWAGELDA